MINCCDDKETVLVINEIAVCHDCFLAAQKIDDKSSKCDICGAFEPRVKVGKISMCLICFALLARE